MGGDLTLDDYLAKFADTLDLSEEDEKRLIADFLNYIRGHEDEFLNRLREIPSDDHTLIGEIIWALSDNPNPWKNALMNCARCSTRPICGLPST